MRRGKESIFSAPWVHTVLYPRRTQIVSKEIGEIFLSTRMKDKIEKPLSRECQKRREISKQVRTVMHQPRSYASLFLSSTKRVGKRVPDTDAEQLTAFLEGRVVGSSFVLMQIWPLPRSRDSSSPAKPRDRPPISLAKPYLSSSQA